MQQLKEIDIQYNIDRVVFIHLAKTAGTTFNAILEPFVCGMAAYPEYDLMKLLYTELEDLRKYHFFSGHFSYKLFEQIFPEGFIGLTFLREPVSRTISNFKFVHKLLQRNELPELSMYENEIEQIKKMNLIEILENTQLRFPYHFMNIQTRFLGDGAEKIPAAVGAGFGKLRVPAKQEVIPTRLSLELAKSRLSNIAFLGMTERFQDSLFLLSYIFGWRPFLNKVHLNPTNDRDEKNEISPDTRNILREKLALDLELYEFGQTLFEKRFNEMTQTLLQRYGTKEQATLKLPLPTNVMLQLLEQHFVARRDRRYKRLPIVALDKYEYTPVMPVEGMFGWHTLENNRVPLRWSGPGLESGFDLPCPLGENIQISFRVVMAPQPHILDGLVLTANNMPVKLMREEQPDGSTIFAGMLPPQAIDKPFIRLLFSVPETIAPCAIDPNNGDTRLLGILLNWVKLAALSEDELHEFLHPSLKDGDYFPSLQIKHPFGWYALEHSSSNDPEHWSGPELESGFDLSCPLGEKLQISFRVVMAIQPHILDGLVLTANNVLVRLKREEQPDGSNVFTGMLPPQAIGKPFVRLFFVVPETIAPSAIDPNNGDTRRLGILLNWVKLVALSEDELHKFLHPTLKDGDYFPSLQISHPFGWYAPEHSPAHGLIHWSGPELEFGFDLPCPSKKNLQISFCVLMALHPDIINNLSLTANGTALVLTHKKQSDGSYVFFAKLPASILKEFIRFIFAVPKTISPSSMDPNNGDSRLLGILVSWVKLEGV